MVTKNEMIKGKLQLRLKTKMKLERPPPTVSLKLLRCSSFFTGTSVPVPVVEEQAAINLWKNVQNNCTMKSLNSSIQDIKALAFAVYATLP
ncbi:hypothetical protein LOAG_13205 [Loa loa]|uniref:Uncharacterized protein n=1 Tax=Loa loa TaxID=7209 RepID=A0A1S0TKD5_LOALO|nr:hypothetical protein LOAG_13205 [Loa loa]EFO15302.1 hypothetical protein LOAG_13205 [Loa loa]